MKYIDYRLQDAFLKTAAIDHWTAPYAVTLTLKQVIGRGPIRERLDPLKASQNLKHFLNLLNSRLLKKRDLKNGEHLRCIPVLEDDGRLHYHLCLDKPAHVSAQVFMNLVIQLWARTDFGYWMVEIKPADAGWIRYMAKPRSKTSFADAIDWANFHNPD